MGRGVPLVARPNGKGRSPGKSQLIAGSNLGVGLVGMRERVHILAGDFKFIRVQKAL